MAPLPQGAGHEKEPASPLRARLPAERSQEGVQGENPAPETPGTILGTHILCKRFSRLGVSCYLMHKYLIF